MLYNCWKDNNWGLLDNELSCDGWIQLNYALIQEWEWTNLNSINKTF